MNRTIEAISQEIYSSQEIPSSLKSAQEKTVFDSRALATKKINDQDSENKRFPAWTEELTQDLEKLNKARVGLCSVFDSARRIQHKKNKKPYSIDFIPKYSTEMEKKILEIKNNPNYERLKGSCFILRAQGEYLREDQYPKLLQIQNDLLAAQQPYENILKYAQQSITAYLEEKRITMTLSIEAFVSRSSPEIARLFMLGKQSKFPEFIREEVDKILCKSEIKITTTIDNLHKKGLSRQILSLALDGLNSDEISRALPHYTPKQISNTLTNLRMRGLLPKSSPEKLKEMRSESMKKTIKEHPDFQEKKGEALKRVRESKEYKKTQRLSHLGQKRTLETRMRISSVNENILSRIYYWAIILDLEPYIVSEITGISNSKVRDCLSSLRKRNTLKPLSEAEKFARSLRSRFKIKEDNKVKEELLNTNQSDLICHRLPLAQKIVVDLLPKLYPQAEFSIEEKEQLAAENASRAIQDYDPNSRMGFHAQIIKRAVQRLTYCHELLYLVK